MYCIRLALDHAGEIRMRILCAVRDAAVFTLLDRIAAMKQRCELARHGVCISYTQIHVPGWETA